MYSVVTLKLETGERLPCLTYLKTGLPVRVANRWVVNYRRKHSQSSTLESNLRDIKLVYQWINEILEIDLDAFITAGNVIDNRQINSLADYLSTQKSDKTGEIVGIGSFNNRLNIAKNFFVWSLRSENRGGKSFLNIDDLYKAQFRITKCFELHNIAGNHSTSYEPLTTEEIEKIQIVIAPQISSEGELVFPENGFKPHTRLRNYLMFEFALVFGLWRSELLKLRLDCLPRGNDNTLKVLRLPDDPSDTRNHEPNVKSAERLFPIPKYLSALIRIIS